MNEITLKLPVDAYARLREMVLAGGKNLATGENGIHSASQLLLFMDQQLQQQRLQVQPPSGLSEAKPNGKALAESTTKT